MRKPRAARNERLNDVRPPPRTEGIAAREFQRSRTRTSPGRKRRSPKYPPARQASAVIAIMWRVQEQHEGWVSEAAIRAVADLLEMPTSARWK